MSYVTSGYYDPYLEEEARAAEAAAAAAPPPPQNYIPGSTYSPPEGQPVEAVSAGEPVPEPPVVYEEAPPPAASPVSETAMANPQGVTYGPPPQPAYIPESSAPAPVPEPAPPAATVAYGGEAAHMPIGNSLEVATSYPASGGAQEPTYRSTAPQVDTEIPDPTRNTSAYDSVWAGPQPPGPIDGGEPPALGGADVRGIGGMRGFGTTTGPGEGGRLLAQLPYQDLPIIDAPTPIPEPRTYNFDAAEPNLADRTLPMRDTAPVAGPPVTDLLLPSLQDSGRAAMGDAGYQGIPNYPEPSGRSAVGASQLYGQGAVDAYNTGYPLAAGTQAMGFNPDPVGPPLDAPRGLPEPNPAVVSDVERQLAQRRADQRPQEPTWLERNIIADLQTEASNIVNTDVAANRRAAEELSRRIPQAADQPTISEQQAADARRFGSFPPGGAPPSLSIPEPPPSTPQSPAGPTLAGIDTSGLSAAGDWLGRNVVDPLRRNSEDASVFGVDVGNMSLPSIPEPSGVGSNATPSVGQPLPRGGTSREVMIATGPRTQALKGMNSAQIEGEFQNNQDGFRWDTSTGIAIALAPDGTPIGYADEAAGTFVGQGNDVTIEQFQTNVRDAAARQRGGATAVPEPASVSPATGDALVAPGTPAPGQTRPTEASATTTKATSDTATTAGAPLYPTSGSTSDSGSSSSSGRSSGGGFSGGGGDSRSSGGYSRSGGRRSGGSWDNDDSGNFDRDFTADDFMDKAGGDRKRAESMARQANARKRSGRGRSGMTGGASNSTNFWPGFPMNRPPSPIRQHVLAALEESKSKGKNKNGKREW
jgi:hypothetical protein